MSTLIDDKMKNFFKKFLIAFKNRKGILHSPDKFDEFLDKLYSGRNKEEQRWVCKEATARFSKEEYG